MVKIVFGWRKPVLRDEEKEGEERKATFLELFFDLVFVAIVAETTGTLAEHTDWEHLWKFLLSFFPCWWCWIGITVYNDRFETNDLSHRVYTFFYMIAISGLAVHVQDPIGDQANGFACSYILARVIIVILWARGGYHNIECRKMTNRFLIFFGTSILFWSVSLLVDSDFKFVLWFAGLVSDLIGPIVTVKVQRHLPKLSPSHFAERFALVVIIVLGEVVIGTIHGVAHSGHGTNVTWHQLVSGVLGLSLSFSLWWIYFAPGKGEYAAVTRWRFFSWGDTTGTLCVEFLHAVLIIGLAVGSAGVLNVVGDHTSASVRLALVGGINLALASLAVVDLAHEWKDGSDGRYVAVRLSMCAVSMVVALIDADSAVTLSTMVLCVALQILVLLYRFYMVQRRAETLKEIALLGSAIKTIKDEVETADVDTSGDKEEGAVEVVNEEAAAAETFLEPDQTSEDVEVADVAVVVED